MAEQQYSDSGDPIYRYEDVKPKDFTPAIGDGESIEAISGHIESQIGKIESVFHEIVSDLVHIDVHWVKPTEKFPFHSLVTSGMSDKPMTVPEGFENNRYAELCILLPANWDIDATDYKTMEEIFKDERNYWPVRWLKTIARFPHQYDTWVGYGHTIPNGENAEPFADNTKLGCMILMPSLSLGMPFYTLKINDEKTIHFYCLYPLYKEEMDFKLKKGSDALLDKFEEHQIADIVDIGRRNTCVKKGLFGLW
jgi:Suppressor of fused protein (SUFU)